MHSVIFINESEKWVKTCDKKWNKTKTFLAMRMSHDSTFVIDKAEKNQWNDERDNWLWLFWLPASIWGIQPFDALHWLCDRQQVTTSGDDVVAMGWLVGRINFDNMRAAAAAASGCSTGAFTNNSWHTDYRSVSKLGGVIGLSVSLAVIYRLHCHGTNGRCRTCSGWTRPKYKYNYLFHSSWIN